MLDKIAIMNKAREEIRLKHYENVAQEAQRSYEEHKNEPLFVAGIMLYWAEGTRLPSYRKYQLALTNSEANLLKVYCNFLRKYFGNKIEPELRAALYIYKDIEESKAKVFWATRLKIPVDQFIKTQILPSRSSLTKSKLPYGTCCVYLNKKDYSYAMKGWIDKMSEHMRG